MVTLKNHKPNPTIADDEEFEEFSPAEEQIVRVRNGVTVQQDAPLKKKSDNKEILHRLLELEQEIMKKARTKGII